MTSTPRPRVPWSHWDKVLFVVLGVVVLVAVSVSFLFHNIDVNPVVTVPTPTLPAQNAYDYFVAAGNAHMEDKWASGDDFKDNSPAAMAAKKQSLAKNVTAFQLLHQGFQYPYQAPPVRSFDAGNYSSYQKNRSLARVLGLEASVDAQTGDWNGSITADLDSLQLGEDLPHGGTVIAMLVGDAVQSIGRKQAWGAVDHLDASQARAAAQRLEHIRADHVPFADTLQEEEWSGQAGLLEMMRRKDWPSGAYASGYTSGDGAMAALRNTAAATRIRLAGKRTIMANYTRYMDQSIANARQPYAAHLPAPPIPGDPLNQIMFASDSETSGSSFPNNVRLREAVTDTQSALLMTMLALRAYKLEHGSYPASLSALVPEYLKAVPADPFALSGPLRYKLQGATYLLYSVGPDGKDDGGQAILDKTLPPPDPGSLSDRRRYIQNNSIGDVVAGVNVA